MHDFDDLVYEDGQEPLVLQAKEWLAPVLLPTVVESVLHQEEHRLHELRRLDEESS